MEAVLKMLDLTPEVSGIVLREGRVPCLLWLLLLVDFLRYPEKTNVLSLAWDN